MKPETRVLLCLSLTLPISPLLACDVCQANQPKFISQFTHGYGPSGLADYIAPSLMLLVMLYSAIRAAQCFRRSADRPHQSAKHSILIASTK